MVPVTVASLTIPPFTVAVVTNSSEVAVSVTVNLAPAGSGVALAVRPWESVTSAIPSLNVISP